jgi:hypothetical protein
VTALSILLALAGGAGAYFFSVRQPARVAPPPPALKAHGPGSHRGHRHGRGRQRRRRHRQTPSPPPAAAIAMDLDRERLVRVLTGHHWRGSLNGKLVFTARGDGLSARLLRPDGSSSELQATAGARGTVTLVLRLVVDGITETHTFHGALTADHRTLQGSYEMVRQAGSNSYEDRGSWYVNALPLPESP